MTTKIAKKLAAVGVLALIVASMSAVLAGCSSDGAADNGGVDSGSSESITYQHLSGGEVAELLASGDEVLLVDVRQPLAYEYEHIAGAINVPQDQIAEQADTAFPDKDQVIILYCDYGGVSKIAAEDMVDMGYTNIIEFDGLEDWDGETVKSDAVK